MENTSDKRFGSVLRQLAADARETGDPHLIEVSNELVADYTLMLQFINRGIKDTQRDELCSYMMAKAAKLRKDVSHVKLLLADPKRQKIVKELADVEINYEDFVGGLRDHSLTADEHYRKLSTAFTALSVSRQWSPQNERLWTQYLLDEDTSILDSCTLVSAISLSCMDVICPLKLRTLVSVYMAADDERLRQRALVGCFLSMAVHGDDPDIKEHCHTLFSDAEVQSDILQMVMQVIQCNDADKVAERIKNDIMPNLIKHYNSRRLLDEGDMLDSSDRNDFDLGKEEREINEMEKYVRQMAELQNSGQDIYFAEFSQMKRYPFFYKFVNWFIPFYMEHPVLRDALPKDRDFSFLEQMFKLGPFCDSDKYSFALAVGGLIDHLPDELKKMIEGDLPGTAGLQSAEPMTEAPVLVRRKYLQELYRFVTLNPFFDAVRVFDVGNIVSFCAECEYLAPIHMDLAKFLLRHGLKQEATVIVSGMTEESVGRYLLEGACYDGVSIEKSVKAYRKVLLLDPLNSRAMRSIAHWEYGEGNYEKASELFARLYEKHPEKGAFLQNCIKCSTLAGHAGEVLNDAFRLDYEHPDDSVVKRLLAWTLLCAGRLSQAESLYSDILNGEYGEPTIVDKINMAELKAVSGEEQSAVSILKELPAESQDMDVFGILTDDFKVLRQYYPIGIYDAALLYDASKLE